MAICQTTSRIAMNATGRSQIFRADNLAVCACLVAVTPGGFLMRQQSARARFWNQRTLPCTLGNGCRNVIDQKGDDCLHPRLESIELLIGYQPDTTAVAVLITAERSTAKSQRIRLASVPVVFKAQFKVAPAEPGEGRTVSRWFRDPAAGDRCPLVEAQARRPGKARLPTRQAQ